MLVSTVGGFEAASFIDVLIRGEPTFAYGKEILTLGSIVENLFMKLFDFYSFYFVPSLKKWLGLILFENSYFWTFWSCFSTFVGYSSSIFSIVTSILQLFFSGRGGEIDLDRFSL